MADIPEWAMEKAADALAGMIFVTSAEYKSALARVASALVEAEASRGDEGVPALIAEVERLQASLAEATRLMTEAARDAGEWKGKYEAAGYPDTLDGWIERAKEAEARAEKAEAENVMLHEATTPSVATKQAYMGEFSFSGTQQFWNDDTEEWETHEQKIFVPWTTIKEIMAAISARAALGDGK